MSPRVTSVPVTGDMTAARARRDLMVGLATASRRYDAAVALATGNAARAERGAWQAYRAARLAARATARARRDAWQAIHDTPAGDTGQLLIALDRYVFRLDAAFAPFRTAEIAADATWHIRVIGTELDRRGVKQ